VKVTRNQTEPRPSSKAPTSKHETQIFASPPVTATRYPERRLHTAPAARKPRPSGAHARSSSSRRLCVLHLSHESPSATQKPAAARAQHLLPKALCLAPATQKPAAAQRRPRAQQLLQKALCTAPATRKPAAVWQGYEMSVLCDEWCQMSAV